MMGTWFWTDFSAKEMGGVIFTLQSHSSASATNLNSKQLNHSINTFEKSRQKFAESGYNDWHQFFIIIIFFNDKFV